MRLFVAVYPPDEVCDDLARRLSDLQVSLAAERGVNTRLARRDTWHVTLAFLGEVAEPRVPDAVAAGERAVDRWRSDEPAPARLHLAGGGRFGRGRFTVLWVGVDGDRSALQDLSRHLRRELKRGRLPYDERPLKPHLTVARPGDRLDREAVDADRAALAAYRGPDWPVRQVELMCSHLGPTPSYERVASWPLT